MSVKPALIAGIFSLAVFTMISSCFFDKQSELYPMGGCDTTAATTYSGVISPIIASNCAYAGCHAGSAPAGGYGLENHAGLAAIAQNGLLVKVINHDPTVSPMPQNRPKMDPCDIGKIERWVANGSQNN